MVDATATVIVLDGDATPDQVGAVRAAIEGDRPATAVARGDGWIAIAQAGVVDASAIQGLAGVTSVVPVASAYRLASRTVFGGARTVRAGSMASFGADAPIRLIATSRWAAGSDVRLEALAPILAASGCAAVHVGAPFAAGSDESQSSVLRLVDIARANRLAVSIEVASPAEAAAAATIADLIQVGSHNMQDFNLLRELGRCDVPIILKRGHGATVEEFLLAAEYVLSHGNGRVILCESGIRTFDSLAKPRFEINSIALLKASTHLPVIADPSRCAPSSGAIPPLAKAAVAAGADGLMLEIGTEAVEYPDVALIGPETLMRLVDELGPIATVVGRTVSPHTTREPTQDITTAEDILHRTDRTLAQVLEAVVGAPPQLDVISQWRIDPPALPTALVPPFAAGDTILARCTGYRSGNIRLSRNLAFVDLTRIDPTLGALLEAEQVNLGQLFVDPRITKLGFEYGTDANAGDIHDTLERCFPDDELRPYLWRRYHATIEGTVVFVVIESLPGAAWDRMLRGVVPVGPSSP